jgi:hypothetical protein
MAIAEYSNIIIAATVVFAVLYAVFIVNRILLMTRRRDEMNAELAMRQFHSNYSPQRSELEREIADLNIRLTQSLEKFNEVNHLILDGQRRVSVFDNSAISPTRFLEGLGVDLGSMKIEENLVFVLTPFHESEEPTYAAIVGALSRYGVRVVRGDEEAAPSDVLSHIIRTMLSSRIVIANVNTRNPNVMYELGIAHALGKDVIIIANSDQDMPFDINSRTLLLYRNRADLVEKLQRELVRKVFGRSTAR